MPNYIQKQFLGTAQTVINTATDIASGDFSGAPAATFDNTNDAAIPYAPLAKAMIEMPDFAAAPSTGGFIELWGVLIDTDGTDDDTDAPSGADQNGARYFGTWPVDNVDALQRRTVTVSLEGVEKVNFYIKNATGQALNNDGGTSCIVKVTPLAYGVAV